jgi:hypothetical protein
MDVNVADRFVDHAAFVNWYVSVVALIDVFPDKKVVPVGVPTCHATEPSGVPLAHDSVIENARSPAAATGVDAPTTRFGVVTVFVSALTDRPVSCVTNFTRRVYDVAFSAGKLDVI